MKHFPRRRFLQLVAGTAALPAVSSIARAQSYPTRPITMIVPFPAGGPTDAVGRVVAERMRRLLGQTVIIENVSGADGSIGVGRAARATPDGYTIVLGNTSTHVLNGAFYSLSYDVLNDFAPISPLVTGPVVLFARKTMPAKGLKELIAWLKVNPNKASAGITAVFSRLLAAFFQKETGTQFTLVPLYVADCLANKHIWPSSEENGEPLSSLWRMSPCGRLGPVFQAPLSRLDGILGRA
jgi:tripartite-type tricarboxylate transporter receptor subunit TctC